VSSPLLHLAAVTGVHGVKGLLRLKLFSANAQGLAEGRLLVLRLSDGDQQEIRSLGIRSGSKGSVLIALEGISSRDAAEDLVGAAIYVRREDMPPLDPDEFYLADVLGVPAVDPQGEPLGRVVDIGDNGAQPLLFLEDHQGRYHVPAVKPIVQAFDGASIVLDLPEGLREALSEPPEGAGSSQGAPPGLTPPHPRAGQDTSGFCASGPWHVVVVTIFPELFDGFFQVGLLGKALSAGRLRESRISPRDFTSDVHRTVDDAPFGGGVGMIMKPEPMAAALRAARDRAPEGSPCLLLTPQGSPFTQERAVALAEAPGLVLMCGRYEGIDDRIRQHLVDDVVSLGDFVLSGGEVAAMAVIEAVSRLLPGVLGNAESILDESYNAGVLEYPQYTRPAAWEGHAVPEILRSGDHEKIRRWRRAQALWRTRETRPDLFHVRPVSPDDERLMAEYPPAWRLHGTVESED